MGARDAYEASNPPAPENHKRDYLSKGIPKPEDGLNVKQDLEESCLTCIKFSKLCHGTEVKEGKCQHCRGQSGQDKTTRSCVWLDPSNNIWNYYAAHQVAGGRQNIYNTKAGIAARRRTRNEAATTPAPPAMVTELAEWPAAMPLLREVASEVDAESEEDDMARLLAIFNGVASRNFLLGDIDGLDERTPSITAQQVILRTLQRMKAAGTGLSVEDVEGLATWMS